MILGHAIAGFAPTSGGMAQFYGLNEGVPAVTKCSFKQYKILAARVSFLSGPKIL